MDANIAEATIKTFIAEIRHRLETATGIAKAAEACADNGNCEKAAEIALDIEQLLYEISTLLNAASMINRLTRG